MSLRALSVTANFGLATLALAIAAASGGAVAQPAAQPAAATSDAAIIDKGRDLFSNYGCASCHTLGDAGATGHVGPAFDGNANLSQDFVVDRITNGQGMMPSFGNQLSAQEISTLAAYIMKVKTK